MERDFPGSPMVRTWYFHCCGLGSILGWGIGVTQAAQCIKNKKKGLWRREKLPTLVFWPEEFHGLYSPWGRKESDMTKRLKKKLKKKSPKLLDSQANAKFIAH